jgi:hypothetical protein
MPKMFIGHIWALPNKSTVPGLMILYPIVLKGFSFERWESGGLANNAHTVIHQKFAEAML